MCVSLFSRAHCLAANFVSSTAAAAVAAAAAAAAAAGCAAAAAGKRSQKSDLSHFVLLIE